MQKFTIAAIAGLVVVGLVGMAGAHKPEGEKYFAFQFEDGAVPVIDGDLSDWAFVPDFYRITQDKLFSPNKGIRDVGRGEFDPSDVFNTHTFGFNPNDEFLYVSTSQYDNYHNADREAPNSLWTDDDWEVRINPTALPEDQHNLEGEPVNYIIYVHAVPAVQDVYEVILPGPDFLLDGNGHLEFGWSWDGEMLDGETTYFLEMKLNPVVALGETEGETVWMDIEEGDEIHMNVTHADLDAPHPATYNGFWAISPGPSNNPEVDLVMDEIDDSVDQMATAVEATSWGLIKEGLSK